MGRKEMTKEQMAEMIKELESKLERRGKNRGDEVIDIIKLVVVLYTPIVEEFEVDGEMITYTVMMKNKVRERFFEVFKMMV